MKFTPFLLTGLGASGAIAFTLPEDNQADVIPQEVDSLAPGPAIVLPLPTDNHALWISVIMGFADKSDSFTAPPSVEGIRRCAARTLGTYDDSHDVENFRLWHKLVATFKDKSEGWTIAPSANVIDVWAADVLDPSPETPVLPPYDPFLNHCDFVCLLE